MCTTRHYLIYIVEGDENDRLLLQQAFQYQQVGCSLRFFSNGAELFIHLTHRLDRKLPDLFLLELDTPTMNGFDTLHLLKQTPEYRHIPVVIRTEHETLDHINRCYELGCQAYFVKNELNLPLAKMLA